MKYFVSSSYSNRYMGHTFEDTQLQRIALRVICKDNKFRMRSTDCTMVSNIFPTIRHLMCLMCLSIRTQQDWEYLNIFCVHFTSTQYVLLYIMPSIESYSDKSTVQKNWDTVNLSYTLSINSLKQAYVQCVFILHRAQ